MVGHCYTKMFHEKALFHSCFVMNLEKQLLRNSTYQLFRNTLEYDAPLYEAAGVARSTVK